MTEEVANGRAMRRWKILSLQAEGIFRELMPMPSEIQREIDCWMDKYETLLHEDMEQAATTIQRLKL